MAAEPSRRNSKSVGLIVRPQAVSDKSYVESVVGFINEVVPQTKPGEKEFVSWVKFEHCDINDYSLTNERSEHNANHPPLLVTLGYNNGVQIWSIPANGEAQEVLSLRQGPVKVLCILPTPQEIPPVKDKFASHRPIVASCDSSSAGEQFCYINFISLKTGDRVDGIKFSGQIVDIKCNKRVLVVVLMDKIVVYNACNLKEMFAVTNCYPSSSSYSNPVALGTRWLAYADRKLSSFHQTCGGMAGDGVQSYAATVIHAAKTITKGLTYFGETVANSFSGHKPLPLAPSQKSDPRLEVQPGIVTILDCLAVNCAEVHLDEDSEGDGIIAHFPAHASEPVAALSFDPSGMLLLTSCRLGHNFNVFRIFPHPASSSLGAVHHLYTLHRGDTTAKVQDITFSLDSRWVAVSTLRGTTHIFPITPYGGQVTVRTHTSPRVVNRLSRFQRSAGLEDIQQSSQTGRNSPVLSGSPGSASSSSCRSYDSHPSMPYPSNSLNRMGNSRLPPYPHPITVFPLAQLKQAVVFSLTSAGKPKSPGKDRFNKRMPSGSENNCVAAQFAPPRAWLVGSPSLTRDKRDKLPMDSLFVIDWHGNLVEYLLDPRPSLITPRTDDSPIELDVTAHAQWNLLRPLSSCEIQPPLPSYSPLMFSSDSVPIGAGKDIKAGKDEASSSGEGKTDELEESWLSQVEIITHAGPHRRLWMGPQFSFQTFQHHSNTTVLSSTSSALLSQSPESMPTTAAEIFTEELDIQSLGARPARSNPVAMPGCHQTGSEFPRSPLLIEASSGSFEQLPNMLEVCGSWPEGCSGVTQCKGKEEQLKESIADAMAECALDDTLPSISRSDTRDFHGSYEELSSSSSHSGSVGQFDPCASSPRCVDHALVFPTSGGSPDSS